MLQIAYISTARKLIAFDELDAILATSRRNNRSVEVTGLLVVGGRRFLQVLEGPEPEVVATFDRIKTDDRHHAVVELSRRSIANRAFGDWSMGFERGLSAEGEDLRSIIVKLVDPIQNRNLRAQFVGFAELHAKAA